MHCGDDDLSPPYITSYNDGPYNPSLASSASSSSASVWSDVASQSSDDSSVNSAGASSDLEVSNSYCCTSQKNHQRLCEKEITPVSCWPRSILSSVAPENRANRRRTSAGTSSRHGCPPPLVRQCDRKVNFVDGLVDSTAQIVEAIWPLSSVACRAEMGTKGVLPLRAFIQETLRRSRTSYSTLQVALYYLLLIKPHVPNHDFTMEQPEDTHSTRALQCGRRMFLSALILASKYLQDRNYSARAWSKISGLNTQEINQNEIAFLIAVNWQLHITDAVFQRWTDIVLKYTPTQPPASPGSCHTRTAGDASAPWKAIILQLNPKLDNLDGILPLITNSTSSTVSARSLVARSCLSQTPASESTTTSSYYTPQVLEPSPSALYLASKPAPALGLLPTLRPTPQSTGFSTPAVSSASFKAGKSSMCFAMAQAATAATAQSVDKWTTVGSSPGLMFHRRSSLANSVSSVSSPESMVSDASTRSSRSSSISSASSLMSAPVSSKLDVQARCRYAKLCNERQILRTVVASVPENLIDDGPTSSPESYTGPVGNGFLDLSLETPLGSRERDIDYFSPDSINDAARVLQELHNNPGSSGWTQPRRAGAKRSRPNSIDNPLQDDVRDLLRGSYEGEVTGWTDDLVRHVSGTTPRSHRGSTSRGSDGRKRVCCSTEAATEFPGGLLSRPGMWGSILD